MTDAKSAWVGVVRREAFGAVSGQFERGPAKPITSTVTDLEPGSCRERGAGFQGITQAAGEVSRAGDGLCSLLGLTAMKSAIEP